MNITTDQVEAAIGVDRCRRALERFNVRWEDRGTYSEGLVLAAIIVELSLEMGRMEAALNEIWPSWRDQTTSWESSHQHD